MNAQRRRLDPDARRRQILDAAAPVFSSTAYDDVRMHDVAARSGVSRALLYRYFPSKRDLFAGVYRDAADGLLDVTTPRSGQDLRSLVLEGLEAHLDYFEANRNAVLAANRTLAGDPVIQTIITEELDELRRRMVDAVGLTGDARAKVSGVVSAWLVFVRVFCVDWLAGQVQERDGVRDVCAGALFGALEALGLAD